MNKILGAIFGKDSKAENANKARADLIALKCNMLQQSRRITYLMYRCPEAHEAIFNRKSHIGRLTQEDKDKIKAEVDKLIESLL